MALFVSCAAFYLLEGALSLKERDALRMIAQTAMHLPVKKR